MRHYHLLFVILLSGALAGCAQRDASPAPPASRSSAATLTAAPPGPAAQTSILPAGTATLQAGQRALSLLLIVKGSVQLKRPAWRDFFPATSGAALSLGDLIRLDAAGEGYILCHDLRLVPITPGLPVGLNNCPRSDTPDLRTTDGSRIGNTRAALPDPRVPYVLSPRHTLLLNNQPVLRWTSVLGVSSYTVKIEGTSWSTTTASNNLPADRVPQLEPGKPYRLIVETDASRSSSEENSDGLTFVVLDRTERTRVDTLTERLRTEMASLPLAMGLHTLAQAQLFAGLQLYAEASSLLEDLHARGGGTGATYLALADIQRQIDLTIMSRSSYEQAYRLAQVANDLEAQGYAAWRLGEIYKHFRQSSLASQWIALAAERYRTLGDNTTATSISALAP